MEKRNLRNSINNKFALEHVVLPCSNISYSFWQAKFFILWEFEKHSISSWGLQQVEEYWSICIWWMLCLGTSGPPSLLAHNSSWCLWRMFQSEETCSITAWKLERDPFWSLQELPKTETGNYTVVSSWDRTWCLWSWMYIGESNKAPWWHSSKEPNHAPILSS